MSKRIIREPERLREDIKNLLDEMGYLVSAVVVEGPRDLDALRRVGFWGRVEICSRFSVSDSDFTEILAKEAASVVILTDFDEEGRRINRHLTRLLERRGVKVEAGMRREFGRLMASLGVYVVEALDDAISRL